MQTIEGLHSAPAGVPTGELGLASDATGSSTGWLIGLGLLVAAAGGVLVARRQPAGRRSRLSTIAGVRCPS